jgi:hypothetical protein
MTRTTTTPDVPPPRTPLLSATGTHAARACRIGSSSSRSGPSPTIRPGCRRRGFQRANGSLAGNGEEAPGTAILDACIRPLNSNQARDFATALLAAAAELDFCQNRIALAHV